MTVCIGEAVIDMFRKNIPGTGDVFMPLPGGCCYNTAITIANLGCPAAFIGRISKNFFGDVQIKRLRKYNVKDDLIIRCDQNPVLAFIKTEEGSQPQYAFYEEGTADRLLSADELPALPSGTECAVFGSISMCMEPVASTIESLLAQCRKDGIVIAFDPNIRPFMIKDRMAYMKRFEKWIGICTIAKISSEDFEYIYPGVEPEDALRKIISLGAGLAIVTLGHKGAAALLCREDKSIIEARVNGIHIERTGDTVGAGDTFHGALLAWLHKRGKLSHNAILNLSAEDLNNALLFANKAAAVVCTRFGAQPPSLEEIEN